MGDPELQAAWDEVHDATPTGWSVARPSRHDWEHERPWHVTAYDYRTAAKRHDVVEATDNTEAEALRDLAELLRLWNVERTEGPRPEPRPSRGASKAAECPWDAARRFHVYGRKY